MAHQAQLPPVAARYFGQHAEHPLVEEQFTPGKGWKRTGYRKRISTSWARKLAASGVTDVALRSGGRLADFAIADLVLRRVSR